MSTLRARLRLASDTSSQPSLAPQERSRVHCLMASTALFASLQAADTVVMVQARNGLDTAAAVADVAMAAVFILILLGLALLLLQLRGINTTVRELSGRMEKRLDPVIDRGKEVAANVEFITSALRTDVQRVSDSVKSLSDRLQHASDRMEQRVEEFNALMEVVQTEAEDIFIGSAAAMRGVRAGARALRDGQGSDRSVPDEAETPPPLDPGTAPTTESVEARTSDRRSGEA